ncbi:MAG TPA: antibiotic biosynthesis monooxygenase [Polyangiaceae bacterium]|jgi:heme-degrading monooxygenase HmoA|nr:antibiotic biosynthesis monooxygenase [Polyangiaceae bacterium]
MPLARTPEPPYWAVIFTSLRAPVDDARYSQTADEMEALAAKQPDYLGIESVRDAAGVGITVSYWASEEAIQAWRRHGDHLAAQRSGQASWYRAYEIRVARVERAYGFVKGG